MAYYDTIQSKKEGKQMEEVLEVLNQLEIEYETIYHPALYTCADNDKYQVKIDGCACKNLFLRNKNKSCYYLFSLPTEKKANLKQLQEKLQETKLSFASEQDLEEKLHIQTGSVSLLNIIKVKNTDVIFLIDETVWKDKKVAFHPNINTATVLFSPREIEKILNHYHATYRFLKMES